MNSSKSDDSDLDELDNIEIQNKLCKAETMKKKGNEYFKNKEYHPALKNYHKAMLYTRGVKQDLHPPQMAPLKVPTVDQDFLDKLKELETSLHNNIAACLLHQPTVPYQRIVELCEGALAVDSENVKAWYRKALALRGLNKYKEAKVCATRANRLADAKDSSIRKLLVTLDADVKSDQDAFDSMFKDKLLNKRVAY